MGILKAVRKVVHKTYMKKAATSAYGRGIKDTVAKSASFRKDLGSGAREITSASRRKIKAGVRTDLKTEASRLYAKDKKKAKKVAVVAGTIGGVGYAINKRKRDPYV